jgi:hypothetical protein
MSVVDWTRSQTLQGVAVVAGTGLILGIAFWVLTADPELSVLAILVVLALWDISLRVRYGPRKHVVFVRRPRPHARPGAFAAHPARGRPRYRRAPWHRPGARRL